MPGFNGRGPRGSGGAGRGRRQGSGAGAFGQGLGRNRNAINDIDNSEYVENSMRTHPYIYQYTLQELRERKAALEEEIRWLNDRIKDLEKEQS